MGCGKASRTKGVANQIGFRVELGALCAQLRRLIDPDQFRAWFVNGEARFISKTDDTVTLAVKDKLFADYITEKFEDAIVLASGVSRCKVVVRWDSR